MAVHWENRIIDLRTKQNSILLYLTIYIMQNGVEWKLWGRGDDQQGNLEEIIADEPIVYVRISRRI